MANISERAHSAVFGVKKTHFCPTCDVAVPRLTMKMPGRTMWGICGNGHSHQKRALILR
jgi:hypothetical protein